MSPFLVFADFGTYAVALTEPGDFQQSGDATPTSNRRRPTTYGTPLEAHLRGLGVSTLVFAGANFPNCPRASIYDASCRDFRLALAEDAVSGLYERGRAELENIGVSLMRSDAVAEAVRNAASSVVASPP